MARRAVLGRLMALDWQLATVTAVRDETPTVRTFRLGLPDWGGHRPGQHVDLRLTAEDGYSVERSYSIASEPERGGEVDITVERIPGGEVSAFLHEVVVPGDQLELRGPIGGYFVWESDLGGPLLLVAGGSGVVPLMAMARHRARAASGIPTRLLVSSRGPEEIIYRDELERLAGAGDGFEVVHTLTRQQPPGWTGYARRIDEAMLAEVLEPLGASARAYACGPTALVEVVANGLVRLGLPPDRVRTERFGPTGT
ncbi:MAG TPA: ferredoxin reductase [Candidatus Limnocylindrales bacterium]|nr:ferredoxin reductase [Candidatus Limnocylindrales bacterium]